MNDDELVLRLSRQLKVIYDDEPDVLGGHLLAMAQRYRAAVAEDRAVSPLDQGTAYLITYADSIRGSEGSPLQVLAQVLDDWVGEVITHVHLLPFFPWTSDDGFGVVDYREVNAAVGTWEDVRALRARRELAFDFVANHTSASSEWFRGWLAGEHAHAGYYLEPADYPDVSRVVRPRTTPLFHDFVGSRGKVKAAWTTFGPDQVDLNIRAPAVLLELTDVLLGYVLQGASTIRLDAIGYLAKRSGTECIHLPETHAVVKLWRSIVDYVRPGVRILTETNVPHADNISYFGDGHDEAHMVYQFALPPLVLHAFVVGDANALSRWAATIRPVSPSATWFNFLASHDGIGLRPTEGLLTDHDRLLLADRVTSHGGRASLADQPDGSSAIYELNVSYLDALCTPEEAGSVDTFARKAVAAHNILLSVVGVPAIYVHSLFGSRSDVEGMTTSGINRRINRAALDAPSLTRELAGAGHRHAVLAGIKALLLARGRQPAFSPWSAQEVLDLDPRVFAVRRTAASGESVLSVTNVSPLPVQLAGLHGFDVLGNTPVRGNLTLPGNGIAWVK